MLTFHWASRPDNQGSYFEARQFVPRVCNPTDPGVGVDKVIVLTHLSNSTPHEVFHSCQLNAVRRCVDVSATILLPFPVTTRGAGCGATRGVPASLAAAFAWRSRCAFMLRRAHSFVYRANTTASGSDSRCIHPTDRHISSAEHQSCYSR